MEHLNPNDIFIAYGTSWGRSKKRNFKIADKKNASRTLRVRKDTENVLI